MNNSDTRHKIRPHGDQILLAFGTSMEVAKLRLESTYLLPQKKSPKHTNEEDLDELTHILVPCWMPKP